MRFKSHHVSTTKNPWSWVCCDSLGCVGCPNTSDEGTWHTFGGRNRWNENPTTVSILKVPHIFIFNILYLCFWLLEMDPKHFQVLHLYSLPQNFVRLWHIRIGRCFSHKKHVAVSTRGPRLRDPRTKRMHLQPWQRKNCWTSFGNHSFKTLAMMKVAAEICMGSQNG